MKYYKYYDIDISITINAGFINQLKKIQDILIERTLQELKVQINSNFTYLTVLNSVR